MEVDGATAVGLCCTHNAPASALSSGFSISQGNAEALDRRGGKAKHQLISYVLGNTSAKNYRNRIVYVNIIASWRWDIFWDMVYIAPFWYARILSNTQKGSTQFYLQIMPCLPFLRKRSSDGATSNWGSRHPIAAYYLFIDLEGMKGWVGLVGWPIADGLPHKWSPVSYRSSAGQGSSPDTDRRSTAEPLQDWCAWDVVMIRLAVLIKHRLVTDKQTDRQTRGRRI